ncbi:RnfABCDGE type electron transport complex subunit D [Mangrovimicrobium sediminis]|uniref:Ion-translocating oxidoreductase complex subunit D n=1 Tax=Mangrovimicrobium sediminis TaxID=2562682 RepID=A0A4Z0M6X5_9GAMM|nr:RnfABCDGE type electron transport complex subunit D [Haliea sp. SAOS-164]TGD75065.1 RnfABCDGE type electron transport complex subunit D [Haliea sp. SAOS-164]
MSGAGLTITGRAAPHSHAGSSVDRIMLQVCLALVPATVFGLYLFGWPALLLWVITCASAVATEALCLLLQDKPLSRLRDSSALLTGWLLALTLPPWAPWWIGAGGAAFAIAVGKQLYGGVGQNIFNPAMLARVALLVSFPVHMTTWVQPDLLSSGAPGPWAALDIVFGGGIPDGVTGPTILGEMKTAQGAGTVSELAAGSFNWLDSLTGSTAGSLGETSELLVLLGGLWLLALRIISWHIPVAMLGTTVLLAAIFHRADPAHYASPLLHLTSGGIMLGAFFIATDYVTSPSSKTGQLIFGAGCAAVLFAIRAWGGFPEGVGFAVLFMNAFTPLLDRYCKPRAYGRNLRGRPTVARTPARKVR